MAGTLRQAGYSEGQERVLRRLLESVKRSTVDRFRTERSTFTLTGTTAHGAQLTLEAEAFRRGRTNTLHLRVAGGDGKKVEIDQRTRSGTLGSIDSVFRLPDGMFGRGIEKAIDAHAIEWAFGRNARTVSMALYGMPANSVAIWALKIHDVFGGIVMPYSESLMPNGTGFQVVLTEADIGKVSRYLLRTPDGQIARPENERTGL